MSAPHDTPPAAGRTPAAHPWGALLERAARALDDEAQLATDTDAPEYAAERTADAAQVRALRGALATLTPDEARAIRAMCRCESREALERRTGSAYESDLWQSIADILTLIVSGPTPPGADA